MYETLEDYRASTPPFILGTSTRDFKCPSGATPIQIPAGVELCMSSRVARELGSRGLVTNATREFQDVYRLYDGEPLDNKTLMVWRAGGFGDLLFIRPCLQKLKELYPTCTIIFGTRADYFDVLKDWECIDSVVPVPLMAWNGYNLADYHLSFHGIVESCREAEQIDIHDIFARHCRLDPDNVEWNTPMVARPPVVGDKEDALQYQYLHKGGYVVVQPRPSAPLRTPLMGSMVAAINAATAQGLPVFVTDTPARFQEVDSLISCCERPDMVHRFNGRGLSDVIRLITWARLVVAPDSAGMHIAAAQGVPSIGLYGPFPGRVRCSRYPLAKWVETPLDPGCCKSGGRECFLHRMEACDSQYSCWKNLDNAKLAAMIKEALS